MNDFEYIAFDDAAGTPIGHGRKAIEALCQADRLAPDASIYVVHLGASGPWVWAEKIRLNNACRSLAATSAPVDSEMLPPHFP